MQCMTGRLYRSSRDLWVQASSALHGVLEFNIANPGYNLEFKELMVESYNNTQQRRSGAEYLGNGLSFEIPTCISESSVQRDFTVRKHHNRRSTFPVVCGDHHASESLEFLQKSIKYTLPKDGIQDHWLFKHFIERLLPDVSTILII